MTLVFPDLHFRASALHMRISKLRAADPASQICANPAGEEAQSSGARSKFGAVPSSNFPCILSFMHLRRPWLLEKLQTESSRRGLGGQGADRGGWQSVKRNIPRPKKVGGPLLVAAERIPGCNLSAATWCRSTQRERSCAATFDLRRRLDQIATKSKLRSK